jgi:dTDP-4-amino-4,6-dideoxygalactose transaminase
MLRVPLNDTKRQYRAMAADLDAAVMATLRSGWYVMGQEHDRFEKEFAAYCGRPFAVAVANGTDALEIALRTVGCQTGDEVVTAANAGGYTTFACRIVGTVPVYADVDPLTLTVSPAAVGDLLGPRTKAVVVTHLYGKTADVDAISALIAGRGIALIEDCAQAHGAVSKGRRAGALGDVAAFSFYPTKNLGALGDGGAIVTGSPEYAARARQLRQYGWHEKYRAELPCGRNSRLDEMQAAILRCKLPHLDHWNQRRREIVARYHQSVRGDLRLVHAPDADFVAHLCIARHPHRDAVRRHFEQRGVATALHYPTIDPQQPAMRGQPWRAGDLSATESAQKEIFTLPCFPEMTDDEVDYVCDALRTAG